MGRPDWTKSRDRVYKSELLEEKEAETDSNYLPLSRVATIITLITLLLLGVVCLSGVPGNWIRSLKHVSQQVTKSRLLSQKTSSEDLSSHGCQALACLAPVVSVHPHKSVSAYQSCLGQGT